MKKIEIITVPYEKQRYETVGDYYRKNGKWVIATSKMKDWRYEMLIAIHEVIELTLIRERGITVKEIEDFDKKWDKEYERGLHSKKDEPGFDKRAPFRKEHAFATKIEKMLAKELGVDWKKYEKDVVSLYSDTWNKAI
ncbi:hypothetical protein H0N95_03035 [Candidatus Micrarchaeota archaeon]|nr:hypothetical protein [Candidatus Micrarchaeota archaeon]